MPPKKQIGRQTVESIPEEETVSTLFSDKPGKNTKGRKKSPNSNMATVGSETSSRSSVSETSSDVGSSIEGIPGTSIRSVGMPDTEYFE